MSGVASRIIPLFGRCLVQKVLPPSKTKGGVLLPNAVAQQSGCQMAKVLAVAKSKKDVVGGENLEAGMTVMVPEFGGMKVMADGGEYMLFRNEDVLAIVRD